MSEIRFDGSGGDPSVAEAVAREIGGLASIENLESEEGCRRVVEAAVERFGRLDVVIHSAGLLVWEELEEAGRSWERMRRVNVDAPFHVTRAAFPVMKEQGTDDSSSRYRPERWTSSAPGPGSRPTWSGRWLSSRS
jgi:NAD(P)-dependent dehydrogenase (short-subunit alcohol dehydrogenase family)